MKALILLLGLMAVSARAAQNDVRMVVPIAANEHFSVLGSFDHPLFDNLPPCDNPIHRTAMADRFGLALNALRRADPGTVSHTAVRQGDSVAIMPKDITVSSKRLGAVVDLTDVGMRRVLTIHPYIILRVDAHLRAGDVAAAHDQISDYFDHLAPKPAAVRK